MNSKVEEELTKKDEVGPRRTVGDDDLEGGAGGGSRRGSVVRKTVVKVRPMLGRVSEEDQEWEG